MIFNLFNQETLRLTSAKLMINLKNPQVASYKVGVQRRYNSGSVWDKYLAVVTNPP